MTHRLLNLMPKPFSTARRRPGGSCRDSGPTARPSRGRGSRRSRRRAGCRPGSRRRRGRSRCGRAARRPAGGGRRRSGGPWCRCRRGRGAGRWGGGGGGGGRGGGGGGGGGGGPPPPQNTPPPRGVGGERLVGPGVP